MTRRKASFLQGTEAARYKLPAEDHRLNHAGLWIPSSMPGAAALAVQSGVVWGPGNPGNVVVVPGGVTVSPFHAAVQGTRSGVQGVFELTSDADEFRAITAASSTQFRRGRLGVRIYDQLNGAAKDDWDLEVLYGPAAASAGAATLPGLPADSTWFELRQFAVDNTGAITLSGITPRTMPRGSILPVDALDVTPGSYAGQYRDHPVNGLERWTGEAWVAAGGIGRVAAGDSTAGAFVGQYRDHPTLGLQRWDGTTWGNPQSLARCQLYATTASGTRSAAVWHTIVCDSESIDTHGGHAPGAAGYTVPAGQGGLWLIEGAASYSGLGSGAVMALMIHVNGVGDSRYGHQAYDQQAATAGLMPTGANLWQLNAGDVVTLAGYGSTVWQTIVDTSPGRGVNSRLMLTRVS